MHADGRCCLQGPDLQGIQSLVDINNYPQTIPVGKITNKWQLISIYRVAEKINPQYLLDPEEEQEAA